MRDKIAFFVALFLFQIFWLFPLWIQAIYISGLLISIFGKFFPFILCRSKDIFSNCNRKKIFEFVSKNPGCTIADVSINLRINRGSVKYHIKRLNSESEITLVKAGKFTRLFQNSGIFDNEDKIVISYLRNETCRNLLLNILENPGITNHNLADKLNLDKSTVHWHISKFQKSDVILYVPEGKYRKCYLNPSLEENLVRYLSL